MKAVVILVALLVYCGPCFAAQGVEIPSKLLSMANDEGNADAMYLIGLMHEEESMGNASNYNYFLENLRKAAYWMKRASDKEQGEAMRWLANASFGYPGLEPNIKEGERLYIALVNRGDNIAMAMLAHRYASGFGGKIDFEKARKYRKLAIANGIQEDSNLIKKIDIQTNEFHKRHAGAKKGINEDIIALAWIYGMAGMQAEGAKWLKLSAERGNRDGQAMLASWYKMGEGLPKDDVLAYMWANIAAMSGNNNDIKTRDEYARYLSKDQLAEAQRLSRNWKPKK